MTPFLAEPDRVSCPGDPGGMTPALSNLTLSVGKLTAGGPNGGTIGFSAAVHDYTAAVAHRNTTIRVTATPNIQGAQVELNYGGTVSTGANGSITDGTDVSPGASIPLAVGPTTIGILVTALDGTTTYAYQVIVTRISADASSDAKLSALAIPLNEEGVGALSPAFKPDVKNYTALVATTHMDLAVTPTITPDAASTFVITSDRTSDFTTGANASATTVPLSVGANVIRIKVTAQNLEKTETYTLTVTRAAVNASDDSKLRRLSLSGITLSPPFDPSENMYTVNVPYRITRTTVTHAVNHSGAMATITSPPDFNTLAAGHQVFLGVDANPIVITVTAENAMATEIYTVTVNRAAASASDNADLTALTIGTGTLSPAFNKDVRSYTDLVPNTPAIITVTATAHTEAAPPVVTSNKGSGKVAANSTDGADSSIATHVITLDAGENVITIMVMAADLETTKTYTLTVTRAAANASDDAKLSTLMVGGESVSVSGFNGGDTIADHMDGVANGVSSIAISATPNHSGAMVVIQTGSEQLVAASPTDDWTVDADGMVDLVIGDNNILIEVTAEDGEADNVQNYFLVITRASSGASDNADLTALTIGTGTLSPAFNKDVRSYTDLVPNTPAIITVTATAYADADAQTINAAPPVVTSNKGSGKVAANSTDEADSSIATHEVTLDVGENVITIMVTAADLETTKTYTLTVTRAAANASDDAKLSTLMVGGESVSVSGFNGGDTIADHMDGVANGVSSIAISATPNHSGAMVVIQTGSEQLVAASPTDDWTVDADGMVDLVIGDNNILIEVTAEDGEAGSVQNYFLVITRASSAASSEAKLVGLTLSGITISPAFSANTMMYSADVPDNIAATTVKGTAAGGPTGVLPGAAMKVAISSDRDDDIGMDDDEAPNIAEHSIKLLGGVNVITIVVTAEDYETMETYTVRVTRGVSNDARLSSLSLMDGDGMAIALMDMDGMTAEFMADTMMYYADVDADVDMIEVMATAMNSDATVSGDGAVSLDVGENTITVTVTAEDGTTMMTYTVMVTVAPPVEGDLLDRYDANDNMQIDKDEVLTAIDDYLFEETISREQVLDIINLYLFREA